jgi:hypothetical protein
MAPEVFRTRTYNAKVDVYSFAMICYQLFERQCRFELWRRHHGSAVPAMQRCSPQHGLPLAAIREVSLASSLLPANVLTFDFDGAASCGSPARRLWLAGASRWERRSLD